MREGECRSRVGRGSFGLFKSWWALGDEGDVDCLTKEGGGGDLAKLGD